MWPLAPPVIVLVSCLFALQSCDDEALQSCVDEAPQSCDDEAPRYRTTERINLNWTQRAELDLICWTADRSLAKIHSVELSVCLSLWLFVCLYLCLSVCLSGCVQKSRISFTRRQTHRLGRLHHQQGQTRLSAYLSAYLLTYLLV